MGFKCVPVPDLLNVEKNVNVWMTLINILVFLCNLYFTFVHLMISDTRMERVGSDDVCEVVVKGQVSNGIELIILPAVLFIPIYIAIGIKFAFENGSFHLLNKWSDLLDEKKVDGKSMSDFNKDKIKTKTDLSFFVGYFAILLAIVISAYVYFFHCHSENAYEISHFLLSLVFIFSGIYAVFVPYNINRAFTITIESRIAMFQAEVKRDLHECGIEILVSYHCYCFKDMLQLLLTS